MRMLILLCIILLLYIITFNTDYVYDLSHSRKINYFNIYDTSEIIKCLKICPENINIDSYLPAHIQIQEIVDKGWGLVTNKKILNHEIVYMCPIGRFPKNVILSNTLGRKKIDKNIHLGDMEKNLDIFTYYDTLLNHSYVPNAFHDINLLIYKNNLFITLIASRDIEKDEEITINYVYLFEIIYILQSYLYYILPNQFNNLTYDHFKNGFEKEKEYLDKIIGFSV